MGVDRKTGRVVVEVSPHLNRPAELNIRRGDYRKAKEKLGWEPRVYFKELVRLAAMQPLVVSKGTLAKAQVEMLRIRGEYEKAKRTSKGLPPQPFHAKPRSSLCTDVTSTSPRSSEL